MTNPPTPSAMKIEVRMEFGSDYQKDFMVSNLNVMLTALKSFSEARHKKNKVTFETFSPSQNA